jgi:organic radical activating enzyme
MNLNVSELFYSLQGEGYRSGEASLFVRLQGCSAKHACYKSGVICDTEFESGEELSLDYILQTAFNKGTHWITWTGGEPTDQLTEEICTKVRSAGFKQSIECSGIKQPPSSIDWVVISPKIAEHVILKKWKIKNKHHCDELRWVRHKGQSIPNTKIIAKQYYLSPHSDGVKINQENLKHCVDLCLLNPQWKLSIQEHKIWKVL